MLATALQPNAPGSSSASNSASTGNVAQLSTLETLGTQPTAAEQQRVSDLMQQFQEQAQRDPAGFRLALREAFGDKASLAQMDQLLDLALSSKLPMPSNIQFVEAGSLGRDALGAYDSSNGGSLYLDRSLLSDPEKLQSVFNEEMGHHLDALLGGDDAAGDEGAVFSRTLEQGALSQSELTALKNEEDHGVIQIGGRWVQVEFREEGGDDSSGGSTGGDDGGGGTESSGGTESGGDESRADSGAGASSGSTGSESTGDTGGECSVDGNNGGGGTPDAGDPDEPNEDTGGHVNGNSDSDKARDAKGTSSTGDQPGSDETAGDGDTSKEENGATTGDAEETQAESAVGTTPDADTESATEPEPEEEKGFWSRGLDKAASGLSFVTNNTPLPDLTPAEAREFLTNDQDCADHVSQVTADDGVVTTVGSYELDYKTPDASLENKTASAGFKVEIDGTAHTVETKGQIGPLEIEGTRKVGTTNANTGLEGSVGLDGFKPKANIDASIGAEVMGVDVKAEASISFKTQDLIDKGTDFYNATVDPVHEWAVGHDVPDMEAYDLPDRYDREITISGHVEAGLGVSGKYSFGGNIGKTGDRSDGILGAHGAGKLGLGPVVGYGASIVID